tara:strand:- start:304 stop:468 length:165 start_codon:yes stop_codon:yes gene_type:complete
MTEIKRNIENSKKLGRIEGKLYTLKTMIGGFCSDDNPLKIQVDDIEKLVKELEL